TAVEQAGHDGTSRVVGAEWGRRAVFAGREQAQAERTEDAAHAVDGNRADRIVDTKVLDHVDTEHDDHTGERSDANRAEGRNPITRTGDRDEAGEEAVHRHAAIPNLVSRQ